MGAGNTQTSDHNMPTYHIFLIVNIFSDPSRHRAHGQVPHPGVRVSGEGPQAVHGRLRCHSCNEQCQTFPLPGETLNSLDKHLHNWTSVRINIMRHGSLKIPRIICIFS